jgi:hypothetical protein
MRFFLKSVVLLCVFLLFGLQFSIAQSQTQAQTPRPATQPADSQAQSKGTVIFSRSAQSDEQADKPNAPKDVNKPHTQSAEELKAELSAEAMANPVRESERVTALALDLRLQTAQQTLASRVEVSVQNIGSAPLKEIRLQISSTLHWVSARLKTSSGDEKIAFTEARIHTDADHTGALNEIVLPLATPLAPGAAINFDLRYAGAIPQAADRLAAIGTPDELARQSDWDRISTGFTGLRGFGNVAWYPVASTPAFLGEGAHLFDVLAAHRKRQAGTQFSLQLTVEYPPGEAPTVAVVNGREVTLALTDANADSEVAGVARASIASTALGFDDPSLFVATRALSETSKLRAWMVKSDADDANNKLQLWTIAAEDVEPFLNNWLGERPTARLTMIELPEPGDASFESGSLLALAFNPIAGTQHAGAAEVEALENLLAHSLTHAWLQTPTFEGEAATARPPWLNEGLANFIASLWLEKQHGRDAALKPLDAARPALALAEPESPGAGDGDPLTGAVQPAYARTKATYVFWMLRDLVGDGALATVLKSPLKGNSAEEINKYFEDQLRQATKDRDLGWFFKDWIDADHGLPDLSIAGFYPSQSSTPGSWIVAVDIGNTGYAAAEVKLTVHSASNTVDERILVPARGKATPRILIVGKPTEVQLNDGTVPETEATVHLKTME